MSEKIELIKDMSIENLNKIIDTLSFQEINYIWLKKQGIHLPDLTKKIAGQIPDIMRLVEELTEKQFFEQEIEVYPGLKVRLRTTHPSAYDESFAYAYEKSNGEDPLFSRLMSMRKLAYAIVDLNGKRVGDPHPTESYAHIALKDSSFVENLTKSADARMHILNLNPLSDKIKEVFLIWETEINKKIQDPSGGAESALKK